MTGKVLVGYATNYGSTREVAEAVAAVLEESGYAVDTQPLREAARLEGCHAVVMGAALYMFRWHKDAKRFLSKHKKSLVQMPVAVFALGPTHDPHDEQEWRESQSQLDKELAGYTWFKPVDIKLFGGKFDPEKLKFPLNKLAGSEPATDIRDWEAIRAWAGGLPELFGLS